MTALAATPIIQIPVADIHACEWNVRKHFAGEKIEELADSLVKTGQIEAVLVRPSAIHPGKYELANGERRYRAALLRPAELPTLAAKVREMTDAEMLDVMLATGSAGNVEPLTPLEEASGYERLMKLRSYTLEAMAAHLGRPVTHVHRRLALLDLPEASREAVETSVLSPRTAWHIARIPGAKYREAAEKVVLARPVYGGVMSEREAAEYIQTHVCRSLQGAAFDVKDATLRPSAGACATCRFRAGNNREEYGDVSNPHTCMSPGCYASKLAVHHARVLTKEATGGKIALPKEENARTYVEGEKGLAFTSDYVAWGQPPTPDLLKREVAKAPKWSELCEGRGVQVYVGIHQDGYAVDLVKLAEAFAAVSEPTLFCEEALQRYGRVLDAAIVTAAAAGQSSEEIAHAKKIPVGQVKAVLAHQKAGSEPAAGSRAAEEKTEKAARVKAEKAQKKKDAAARAWLRELQETISTPVPFPDGPVPWRHLPYWTLLYEHAAQTLSTEEVQFVLDMLEHEPDKGESAREALECWAGGLSLSDMAGLVTVLLLVPRIRAQGAECPLAVSWHRALMAEPESAPAGTMDAVSVVSSNTAPYTWNEHGVCTDPEELDICGMPKGTSCRICMAEAPDGSWRYGYGFQGRGPRKEYAGGGPSIRDTVFAVRIDAYRAGLSVALWFFRDDASAWAAVAKVLGPYHTEIVEKEIEARKAKASGAVADPDPEVGVQRRDDQLAEQRELGEIAKAHGSGMHVLEIARSYGRPVAEVCGMLEVPVPADVPALPPYAANYQVREIIGYDNAGQTLEEIAGLMHRDLEWVKQVLRACGRDQAACRQEAADAAAALDAAFAEALPGCSSRSRAAILRKYILRVCKSFKPEAELTAPEKLAIVAILRKAIAGRRGQAAQTTVTTADEREAA